MRRSAGDGRQADALGFKLLEQGRGRVAVCVEGATDDRHELLGRLPGRRLGQHAGTHGQTARGGEPRKARRRRPGRAAARPANDAGGEGLAEAGQRLGRQFFGQQFNEQESRLWLIYAASFVRGCAIGKPRASRES